MISKKEILKFDKKRIENIRVGVLGVFSLLVAVATMYVQYEMKAVDIFSISLFLSAFGMGIIIIANNWIEWREWKTKK